MKFEFSVDRGGTFTDVFCVIYGDQGQLVGTDRLKLLSEDYHYEDPISEGIRRIISKHILEEVPALIPSKYIQAVRIGTTIGTNALLERKGARTALVMTKGFKDLLKIGNQSRPRIFELDIKRPPGIYETAIEIDERIGVRSIHEPAAEFLNGLEEGALSYSIDKTVDETQVLEQFKQLKEDGIESVAICLLHSHEYGGHELKVGELAHKAGFESIFLSHQSSPKAGYLARSSTCLLDAYLSPILRKYTRRVASKFENNAKDIPIYMMQSDGALTSMDMFTGSKSILSGPAGGVAGYAKTTPMRDSKGAIGFDMGGTSTDVSTFEGTFEMNYESEVAGVFVSIPHLDINTVAAGGGSCLYFENGLMRVGPESAGSNPGPVCYGKDGLLAVTDLNLILGRIQPEYFPKIFGKDQNEPLNYKLSKSKFEELADRIRRSDERLKDQTTEEIAFGFIQVANEVMCRPIRALTESRGKDPKNFNLGIFGGAGSQHACAVARNLGIKNVFIHKYSSILSAYGIFLADILKETSLYCNTAIHKIDQASLLAEMRTSLEATKVKFLQTVPESSVYSLEDEISYVLKFSPPTESQGMISEINYFMTHSRVARESSQSTGRWT